MDPVKQPNDGEPKDKTLVSREDIRALLCLFASENYTAGSTTPQFEQCLKRCTELMKLDYNLIEVNNSEGSLCFQYPSTILIPKSEKHGKTNDKFDENNPGYPIQKKTQDLFKKAQYARCRQRFPVPVMLFQGKFISRSATLASVPEVCYRFGVKDLGFESLWSLKEFLWPEEGNDLDSEETSIKETTEQKIPAHWQITEKIRTEDVELLKYFRINTIFDLMVEKRKIKHGLFVSSSEKVNRDRYTDFKVCVAPYPGCEFFKKYHNTMFKAKNLYFDWAHPQCDIELSIPNLPSLNINWDIYKNWDLITMTKNYITYILQTLQEDSTGVLVHCISGWDRTPLFISLLRILLWAEGHIHKSLNAMQLLYLTLAYDWMLFGHCLQDRLIKREEIMYFCFGVLKFFIGDRIVKLKTKTNLEGDGEESLQSFADESSEEENDDDEFVLVDENLADDMEIVDNEKADLENVPCQDVSISDSNSPFVSLCSSPTPDPAVANDNLSNSLWTTVTHWGSIKKDKETTISNTKRDRRLNSVRRHFIDAYFKTIKKDCYGPVKCSPIESVILSLAEFVNSHMPS